MEFGTVSWIWLAAGVLLILSEFAVPGLVICFFGASAVILSLLCMVFEGLALNWQLFIFAVLGAGLLMACRLAVPGIFKGRALSADREWDIDSDDIAGASAVAVCAITPDTPGKVDFRGSLWSASAGETIPAGCRVKVESRDNLMLTVSRIDKSN